MLVLAGIDKAVVGNCGDAHFCRFGDDYVKSSSMEDRFASLFVVCSTYSCGKVNAVSSVQEIQAAIPKLSRAEIEQIREWIEDYLEGRLELSDDARAKLDQSRAEIAAGSFTTRRAK